jgi:hypothetical protein
VFLQLRWQSHNAFSEIEFSHGSEDTHNIATQIHGRIPPALGSRIPGILDGFVSMPAFHIVHGNFLHSFVEAIFFLRPLNLPMHATSCCGCESGQNHLCNQSVAKFGCANPSLVSDLITWRACGSFETIQTLMVSNLKFFESFFRHAIDRQATRKLARGRQLAQPIPARRQCRPEPPGF